MQPDNQQLQLFRSIRGAPATILLLLVIRGASMTNLELCEFTGFSAKTTTTSMRILTRLGFVQYNGRLQGWSLKDGIQLSLPLAYSSEEPVDNSSETVDNSLAFDPADIEEIVKFTIYDTQKTGDIPGDEKEIVKFTISDDPNPPKEPETAKEIVKFTIYPAPLTTTTLRSSDPEKSSSSSKNARARTADDPPDETTVAYWLRRAGVGATSPKYRQLLAQDLDVETVRAHALERLAHPAKIHTGLFITRLEQGDPAPAPRCETCYGQLDQFGMCVSYSCLYQDENEEEPTS